MGVGVRDQISIFARLSALVTLVIVSLVLESTAAANVIRNERLTFTVTNVNPCAVGDGLVTWTMEEHDVWQELADGTILVHSNFHGTGTSATGVGYILSRHQVITVVGGVSTGTLEVVRISKGPSDNVHIEATFTFDPDRVPPLIEVATFRCVG